MPCLIKERIGIFGGAFDPPHRGHEKALAAFCDEISPQKVYVIPTGLAPHKEITQKAKSEDRLAMAKLAFLPVSPSVAVSDMEILAQGTSFTEKTVRALRKQHPHGEFYLFVGTDQFLAFETWRNVPYLLSECTVCAMERFSDRQKLQEKKEALEKEFGGRFLLLEEKPYIISSSEIRRELEEKGYSFSLSPQVNQYLAEHNVYFQSSPEREKLLSLGKKTLPSDRFSHTLGVERETDQLCRLMGLGKKEREVLTLAALAHDLTKPYSTKEHQEVLARFGENFTLEDLASPPVLHAVTAAKLAEADWGFKKEGVNAIRYHTTGREEMSLGEMILFLADFMEETRLYPSCRETRKAFYEAVNKGEDPRSVLKDTVYRVLLNTVNHLKENCRSIHPESLRALAWLRRERKEEV